MRREAIKYGWSAWLGAIFLIALLPNHALAAESQPATGNAFSKIKPVSQQVHPSFNIRKTSTKANVGKAVSSTSEKVAGANNVTRFGKLSLILSTELTSAAGNQSIPSRGSTRALNRPQGDVVKNDALNDLNAQIASLEAVIKAQQLQIGMEATGKQLPEQATQSVDSAIPASDSSRQSLKQTQRTDSSEASRVQQSGMKMKGSWLTFGLVVVVLVVALVIVWMRNQKAEPFDTFDNDQIAIKIHEEPEDIQGSALTPPENTDDKQLIKQSGDDVAKETLQSILPPDYEMLEEADIYLRFGHDKLAEEALREAIKINSQNPHAYLTLLRIYFSRDDADGFLELAKQVKSLGDKSVWSKVAEMGRNLDEGNSLYQ